MGPVLFRKIAGSPVILCFGGAQTRKGFMGAVGFARSNERTAVNDVLSVRLRGRAARTGS